ncbi:hypothetical protein HIF56_005057 [Escherichia coli]|nr:hypothetical protein [Escherichia coli]EFI9790221.1 hypothetical protein [Escherichia coli]
MKCHKSSMWEMGSKIPVQNLPSGGRKLVILTCSPFGGGRLENGNFPTLRELS